MYDIKYSLFIKITCPRNVYPLIPHFYIVNFKTGVYRGMPIFLILDPKQRLWVQVRTASTAMWFELELTITVVSKNNILKSENFHSQSLKKLFILHGRVFIMISLKHLSLASLLWDIGKQNSPICDSVPSGAILFA